MRLEHIAFNVAEPAQAAAWYAAQLGMRVVRAQQVSPFAHFLADSRGQTVLEFYNNPLDAIPDYTAINPFRHHIAYLTADIAAERERLLAAGASTVGDITPTPAGDKLAFLRDPWGLPLQLVERAVPLL